MGRNRKCALCGKTWSGQKTVCKCGQKWYPQKGVRPRQFPRLKCCECAHEWFPKSLARDVLKCPVCHSTGWDSPTGLVQPRKCRDNHREWRRKVRQKRSSQEIECKTCRWELDCVEKPFILSAKSSRQRANYP